MAFDWHEHNYHDDFRVANAREQRLFNDGCNLKRMTYTFTTENDDGEEIAHVLPLKYEVCHTCEGRGVHVNPSIDAGGIGQDDEFWEDDYDDEIEDEDGNIGGSRYMNGYYDVPCYTCGGKNVVPSVDRQAADPEVLKVWDDKSADAAECEAICRAERRMGA